MKEALLYEKLASNKVRCRLCAHGCTIAEGKTGICHVRRNDGGTLYTLVYGRTIAQNVDPIEKKPLFHFHPGSKAYSIATPGCNFRCGWCQNAEISQMPGERHLAAGRAASPEEIVAAAQQAGCGSIAYTYTEPTIFFEYSYDTARRAREAGIANIYVTNGFMTQEALETIHPCLDAANVDLKAFRDDTYRQHVGARLQPVLDSLKTMKRLDIWVEVTTLVIPGLNDGPEELRDAARFVARELGPHTPWHISRFAPAHKFRDLPPTPVATLRQARDIGREEGLHYVYLGNIPGEADTTCHSCGRVLVRRHGFAGAQVQVTAEGQCPGCGTPVAGVGMAPPAEG
ncbi:MAG: AmmeMemoRadiSam system radical SAM enzyme [bacterium]